MKTFNIQLFVLTLLLTGLSHQVLNAQQWYTNNGNFYTYPGVKVGIGTVSPQRSLEARSAGSSYIRVSSLGGVDIDDYAAGIELKRDLLSGGSVNWTLENKDRFQIKRNYTTVFSMSQNDAKLGNSTILPTSLTIYGKNVLQQGSSQTGGALSIESKLGNSHHNVRIDGNQLESKTDFYFNHLSSADLIMANGGGTVGIGTSDNQGKLNISTDNKFQMKLTNPGPNGASWRVGVANSNWAAGSGKLVFTNTSSSSDATLTITPAGKVGIGLTTPSRELHVNGTTRTKVLEITGGADLAEPFSINTEEDILPGMVVSIDPQAPGQLKIAESAYEKTVAGIVSGAGGVQAGMIMAQEGTLASGEHPVALTGRVYCRVDAAYGAIQPGDLLTTSQTPGHAMKVSDPELAQGAIIGKAMTSLDAGTGLVLVLVSLQ